MAKLSYVPVVILALVGVAAPAAEQPQTQATPDQKPPSQTVGVTVASVTGQAEWLPAGNKDEWRPLKAGDELAELAVIRTGLRSKVVLVFADRGQVEVGAATKIGIAEFRKQADSSTTRLGLKYGSMRATVDSTRGPNDTRISTPVATLSVRGSQADIGYSGGTNLRVRGQAGQWQVAAGARTRTIAAGESTDGNLTPPTQLLKYLRDSHMAVAGLSAIEIQIMINNPPTRSLSQLGILTNALNTTTTTIENRLPRDHIIIGM